MARNASFTRPFSAALLAAGLTSAVTLPALAQTAEPQADIQQISYLCERGVILHATYINSASGESFAVLQAEGRQLALKSAVSASGARYIGADMSLEKPAEGTKAVSGPDWWTKGDTGTLSWFDADYGEQVTLYHDCAAQTE